MKLITKLIVCLLALISLLAAYNGKADKSTSRLSLALAARTPDTAGWTEKAYRHLLEEEYTIKYDDSLQQYTSPNRYQNLRVEYSGNLLAIAPAADPLRDWQLRLQLHGIYVGSVKQYDASGACSTTVSTNRIDFHHQEAFTVNYINTPEGVRQNFIVQQKPSLKGNLAVRLSVNEGWEVRKASNGELHFMHQQSNGQWKKEITYNSLKAWDAHNKALDAWFTVSENKEYFLVEVNTDGAEYPLTIDPLSSTEDWVVSGTAEAEFGKSVASAGDVNGDGYSDVIVGEPRYEVGRNQKGRALVYYGSASGLSTEPGWIAVGDAQGEGFGEGVAGAGDINGDGYSDVIIGAHRQSIDQTIEGAAYIYYGSASGLQSSPATVLKSGQAGALFGTHVSGAGDVNGDGYSDVMVASPDYDYNGITNTGAVFIYYGSAAGISTTAGFVIYGSQLEQHFGHCINAAGDINGDGYTDLLFGSPDFDFVGTSEGLVSIYYGSSEGISEDNKYSLGGYQSGGKFGYAIAGLGDIDGDGFSDVMISAPGYANGQAGEGAVFMYYGRASGVPGTYDWMYESNRADAGFGENIAAAGDINADGYADVLVSMQEDSVYLFEGSASRLKNEPDWRIGVPGAASMLGYSMGCAGDVNGDGYSDVVVGMYGAGKVYGFYGSPAHITTISPKTFSLSEHVSNFGYTVSSAGDVNGDGYDDVIVGAPLFDNGRIDRGLVHVYYGSSSGLPESPSWSYALNYDYAEFGTSVAAAGDVNGDGYDDIIVGAPFYSVTISATQPVFNSNEGKIFIFYGSASGLSATPGWERVGPAPGYYLGMAVAGVGDVNGDGFADVALASSYANSFAGVVYIHHGSADGPEDDPAREYNGTNSQGFSISVTGAGDLNGDGYSDLVVGSDYAVKPGENNIYVYHGSSSGLPPTPNLTIKDNINNPSSMGRSVASGGDINGDGFSDLLIGHPNYIDGGIGRVLIHYGSPSGIAATPGTILSYGNSKSFGFVARGAGDVNGDGYSDIIIGDNGLSNGHEFEGAAYVYFGAPAGQPINLGLIVEGNETRAIFGNSVDGAGDVNGDGLSDFIVGAPNGNAGTGIGKAFVYTSNPSGAVRNNLQLYNADLVTPIQQQNYQDANFGAGLFVKSPMGRVKGRLVWEAVPQGASFSGGNGTAYTGRQEEFTDLGLLGLELKALIAKAGKQTKLRVRVEYQKAGSVNGQIYGPWHYPSGYMQGANGMGSTPLPVKLERFTARYQQGDVLLDWNTSAEENTHSFEVERSLDGTNFAAIGRVTAAGIPSSYSFTDRDVNSLSAAKVFYRLRIIDIDQSSELSKVVPVTLRLVQSFAISKVFPNPASSYINITIESPQAANALFTIFDVNGRQMKAQQVTLGLGTQTINMNTASLPAGVYVLRVQSTTDKRTEQVKFLKN